MCDPVTATPILSEPVERTVLLRRFLDAYWLRPENAFWMTLRSETLSGCTIEAPSVDLGCGDGVFAFLHCGGVLDPAFDVFSSVAQLDRVRDRHADMFDWVGDDYRPKIQSPPTRTIDVGADLKPTLLAKARLLNLYGQLVEHDNNRTLPFADASFRWVHCNAAYWVDRIDSFLKDLRRITRPDGRVVLQVKLDSMRSYTLESHRSILGDRLLELIGRGRAKCWPSLASRSTWESRFEWAGLTVQSATPFITPTHAHIWDVGLRPIAPLLVKMTRELDPNTRSAIKGEWVDLFCELLAPICEPALDLLSKDAEPAEIQYVLTPD